MASLHVKLLGAFEIRDGSGAPLGPLGRKAQGLLAILALNLGATLPRDKLSALLWSDRDESQARGSLRHALAELRKVLADLDPAPLIADREMARIDPDTVEVDAVTFERLIDEDTVEALATATELYRGDLLDGFDGRDAEFEVWLRTERERLRGRAGEVLTHLLDQQVGSDAIDTARRLLTLDPLNEATHRALMRLYAETNNRRMALKQYETCREVLQAELGLEPEAHTERLLKEIRASTADQAAGGITTAPPKDKSKPMFDMSGSKKVPVIGGCLCGEIRYEVTQPVIENNFCHCRMCQRFAGAPVVAQSTYPADALRFTKGGPKYYKSSPFAERGFCANCGSSLTARALTPPVTPDWADWIVVFAASLDNPEPNAPTWHLGVESQMPWVDIRHARKRVRCQDSPDIVEAWAAFNLPVP
jgi:DNA-binding SARP family transcriptional activator